MELMGQLRMQLSDIEVDFFKEVNKGRDANQVSAKYADAAAAAIVRMLLSFNPEITEEEVSRDASWHRNRMK